MKNIFLCNIPYLDLSYNNVLGFPSKSTQKAFFNSAVITTIPNVNIKHDSERTLISIRKTIEEVESVDYLFFDDDLGNTKYYFVTKKEYVSNNLTNLIIEIDVWSTNLFKHELLESLIERCHVDRWNSQGFPTNEIVEEGLEYGELVNGKNIKLYENNKAGKIIVTNIPIGKIKDRKQATGSGGSGGGGADTGGSPRDGIVSAKGYRFVKGFEGFGKYPYYGGGENFRTFGYGITENFQTKYFNQMLPAPVSEQKASEVFGDMMINAFGTPLRDALQSRGVNMDLMPANHFDAFNSLAMNMGLGGLIKTDVFKWYVEKRNISEIANRWLETAINSGTVNEAGLRKRRKAESDILLLGEYNFRSIVTINQNGGYGPVVTENNGNGFIPPIFGSLDGTSGDSGLNANIVKSARKLIGKPYVFGGNYPPLGNSAGTDCSGLIQWAFNDNERKITRTTYTQIKEGSEVYKVSLRSADLIFMSFSSASTPEHVVLFDKWVDKEKGIFNCIEAPRTGLNIRERQMQFTDEMRARRLV